MPAPSPWRLLLFLGVATFFEGFDLYALAQLLPQIRHEFGLGPSAGGWMVAAINVGTIASFFLIREADRRGRKTVLTWTILGYTVASLGSALAPNVWVFTLAQLASRFFLIAEWAIASIYAAEEFPAERRGLAIGIIQGSATLGAVACAGVVPLLLHLPWGWRSVFAVGAIPLLLTALARRNLPETQRFLDAQARGQTLLTGALTRIWRTPYRARMLQLAAIWAFTYVCSQSSVTFFKEFALAERGFTDAQVGQHLTIAAVAAIPLLFGTGKLLDVLGRRAGAVLVFTVTVVGIAMAYLVTAPSLTLVGLVLGMYGSSAVLPVLNAWTNELFPTELRSDAFGWSNALLGRVGFVLGPILVGQLAEVIGWGRATATTALFPVVALALILLLLPETSNRSLEETSRL